MSGRTTEILPDSRFYEGGRRSLRVLGSQEIEVVGVKGEKKGKLRGNKGMFASFTILFGLCTLCTMNNYKKV